MALNYFGIEELIPFETPDNTIPLPNVKKALKDYYNRTDRFTIPKYDQNGAELPGRHVLKGFSFDKNALADILTNTSVDRVMFAFGYHDGSFENSKPGFTLIMIGIDVNVQQDYNLLLGSKMYDFCEPCPTKCTIPELDSLT